MCLRLILHLCEALHLNEESLNVEFKYNFVFLGFINILNKRSLVNVLATFHPVEIKS